MKTIKMIWIFTAVMISFIFAACSSNNSAVQASEPESQSASISAAERSNDSIIELQQAAGVVSETGKTNDMAKLAVKNGMLYRGDTPVDTSITELNLSGLDFNDWSFLANFSELEVLNLDTADLTAYSMLKELKQLRTLLIANYPAETLEELRHCTKLEQLIIATAPALTDVSALSELNYLNDLELIDIPNQLDTSGLSGWTDLSLLKLNHVTITSLDFVSQCPAIQTLILQSVNGIEDFSPISQLSELNELRIVFTDFSQLDALKGLTNLTSLSLFEIGTVSLTPIAEYELPLERFHSNASEEELAILKNAYPTCIFE